MDLVGNMDKVVVFSTNAPTTEGAGKHDVYSTLLTTRGFLERSSGDRSLVFGEIDGNSSWTLIVRKQAALTAALAMSLKVEIDGRLYTVTAWEDIKEKHFYYKFNLTYKVA